MTGKRISSADNYFIFPYSDGHAVGVSKNGVCYRVDESGELIPVISGDEFAVLFDGSKAVRRGQTIKRIN